MKNMNFKPAFLYRLKDSMRGALIFWGIFTLVIAVLIVGFSVASSGTEDGGTIVGYSFAASITMFVFGICAVREDLRLMMQNGIGRRTVFLVELCVVVVVALGLAIGGELLLLLARLMAGGISGLTITDIFPALLAQSTTSALPVGAHLLNMLFTVLLLCCASYGGMLISLFFYRLPRPWNIVAAIGLPLLFVNGIPFLFGVGIPVMSALFELMFHSVGSVLCTMLVCALLCAGLSWLLLRRAPVQMAK